MSEPSSPKSVVAILGALALHAFVGLVLLYVLLKVVPSHEKIFKDFGAALPAATLATIAVSRFVACYWWLVLPVLGGIDAAILVGLNALPAGLRWIMLAWSVVVAVAILVLAGLIMMSVSMPLGALLDRLSQ
jgi:hypothetical protein